MRRATTPGDPGLRTFLNHRPDASDARLAALWRALISAPVERALADPETAVAASGSGEVYRAITRSGEFEGLTAPASPALDALPGEAA